MIVLLLLTAALLGLAIQQLIEEAVDIECGDPGDFDETDQPEE